MSHSCCCQRVYWKLAKETMLTDCFVLGKRSLIFWSVDCTAGIFVGKGIIELWNALHLDVRTCQSLLCPTLTNTFFIYEMLWNRFGVACTFHYSERSARVAAYKGYGDAAHFVCVTMPSYVRGHGRNYILLFHFYAWSLQLSSLCVFWVIHAPSQLGEV